jgi:hypothetical protein
MCWQLPRDGELAPNRLDLYGETDSLGIEISGGGDVGHPV